MTFQDHINKESLTISNFITTQQEIKITNMKNDSFSTYDFEIQSGSTEDSYIKGVVEAKTRKYSSTKYSGGILLEVKKLSNILSEVSIKKKSHRNEWWKGFYLVKYTDVTYLFDLESVNISTIQFKLCPVSSSSNGSTEWIDKPVVLLNPNDAVITINH